KKIVQGKPESRWKNHLRGHENLGLQPGVNGEETPYEKEEKLIREQEEWDWKRKDTFDEFIYESKELDEKEEYCTLESEKELDIYDNPHMA
ncbi:16935_t:CDS:2, partial [Gigaspora margarita]